MPELPDIALYVERAQERLRGQALRRLRILSPFVLRTALPPIASINGRRVEAVQRLGKRVVLRFEGDATANGPPLFLVIHLMIAGRLRWEPPGTKPPGRIVQAVFEFDHGLLMLTEAGTQRRASIHLVEDEVGLATLDPGGVDVASLDAAAFGERLKRENHTLKRSLTDPRLFSGIGNSYSDEILHRARMAPTTLTKSLDAAAIDRLHAAALAVLAEWTERLRTESPGWPQKVTAFHRGMAVHGRYGQPCPVCAAPVQRIVHANNETNYCARCQTGGRLLADRALSTLLKKSWPRNIDDLE